MSDDDKRSGGDGRTPPRGGKKPFAAGDGPRRRGVSGDAPPRRSFRDREEGEGRPPRPARPARSFAESSDGERRPSRFKPREGEASEARPPRKTFRDRDAGGERPFKPRPSFRDRDEGGEAPRRPFRPREDREGGEARPRRFEDRAERGGDRPFRPRTDAQRGDKEERPFRARREDREGGRSGDRPFRPRSDAPRSDREERPFRARREDREGDGPARPRHVDTAFEPREGRSSFEPRFDERRENRPERPAPRRAEKRLQPREDTVKQAPAVEGEFAGDRVAKVIARAGLGSRRDAEAWIEEGRVAVNGEVLTSAARNVLPTDKVTVDGKLLPRRERTRLWLYHKPRGLVTTEKDPEGRPTVFENLDPSLPRVMSVGRLDINTEGLLLLTNDGGLARQLELPKTGWLRRYRVRAFGETDQVQLDKLFEGLTIDGVDYGRIEAKLDKEQGSNSWLTLGLREGKNREVKNVLGSIGLEVNRLIRVSYGPFQLGELAEGAVEEVKTRVLIDQLGPDLIAEAECEFEAPAFERGELAAKPVEKPAKAGRGLRVKAEEGGKERVIRGGLVEDRHGRRVLVQRVADVPEDKPAKRSKRPAFRDREEGGERPFKPRASFRDRDEGGDRPRRSFRDRDEGNERPPRPRPAFREGDEGAERPRRSFRERYEGEKPPFKPRPSFRDREEGSERPRKPFRAREGAEDRPFRPRPARRREGEEGERASKPRPSFRDRNEGGSDRPFKPRSSSRDRDEGGERPRKPFGDREGGGNRPFKPRSGGGKPTGSKPSGGPRRGR
ncbi:pseudouridine synthase [Labrys okinawensis]|uniref:pseudouridine synthase n=1 Tax=Labrys okinawensis TaxID=346911 RepID=UPI0039BD2EA0